MYSIKESPQAQRRKMIERMEHLLKSEPTIWRDIEYFEKIFMRNFGSSKVKTDEYLRIITDTESDYFEFDNYGKFRYVPKETKSTV